MIEGLLSVSGRLEDGTFTCMDLVRCMFNLNDTELNALRALEEGKAATAGDLAERIDRDRSTTYRALEKLAAAGLVYKERRGGERRGYSNVYRRLPRKDLDRKAEKALDACYRKLKRALREGD